MRRGFLVLVAGAAAGLLASACSPDLDFPTTTTAGSGGTGGGGTGGMGNGGGGIGGTSQGMPVEIAVGQLRPWAIAVDLNGSVYWSAKQDNTNWLLNVAQKDGTGFASPITETSDIDAVAVDSTNLYWAKQGSMAILKTVPTSSLSALPLVLATPNSHIYGIAAYGGQLYYTEYDTGRVMSVDPTNAPPFFPTELVKTGTVNPASIAVDDTGIYWLDATSVWKADLLGGNPKVITPLNDTGDERWFDPIALDGLAVYWGTSDGVAYFAPKSSLNASPMPLYSGTIGPVYSVAPRGLDLYFTSGDNLWKMAIPDGIPAALEPMYNQTARLASDSSNLFFTVRGDSGTNNGSVVKWAFQ